MEGVSWSDIMKVVSSRRPPREIPLEGATGGGPLEGFNWNGSPGWAPEGGSLKGVTWRVPPYKILWRGSAAGDP
jgi:hypothetical protein